MPGAIWKMSRSWSLLWATISSTYTPWQRVRDKSRNIRALIDREVKA